MDAGTVEGALIMRDLASQVIARVEGSLGQFQKALGETAAKAEKAGDAISSKFARNLKSAADTAEQFGTKLSLAISAPLAAAGAASIYAAADYEKGLKKLVLLGGSTQKQVNEIADGMRALAEDTGVSIEQLMEGMFAISSAGIRGAEGLKVLDMAAKASAMGMGGVYDISRTLTSAMTAFKSQGLEAAQAMAVMIGTIEEGNLPVASLADTLPRVMASASQAGVAFSEVGAFIATMSRTGMDAQMSVIGLSNILKNFTKPTQQARDALASVNTSFEAMKVMIQEKGLGPALIALTEAFKDNDTGLAQIVGDARSWRAVMASAGSQADILREITGKLNDSLANGAEIMEKKWSQMQGGFGITLKQLAERLKDAGISLGLILMPAAKAFLALLVPLTDGLKYAVVALDGLPGPVKNLVLGFGGLLVILPPLALGFAKLAGAIAGLAGAQVLGPLMALGNTIPVLTARVWLLDAAQKAAALSATAMAAAQTLVAETSLVQGARLAAAGTAAKALAASQVAASAVGATFSGLMAAVGSSAAVMGAQLAAARVATVAASVASGLATAGTVALGVALLALKWILAPLVTGFVAFKATLAALDWSGASDGIEYFSLRVQRFLGLIDSAATNGDLWNSVQEGKTRRAAETAGKAINQEADAVKQLRDQLSGADLAKQAAMLATAFEGMGAAEKKNPDVLKRVAEQADALKKAGATLPPSLQAVTDAMAASGMKAISYSEQLADARKQLAALKASDKLEIAAGIKMGTQTPADIANRLKIPEAVVELYKKQLEDVKKADEAVEGPARKLAKTVRDLTTEFMGFAALPSAGGMTRDWLEENADAILKAARNAQALGQALPTAFKVAAQEAQKLQVAAFATERAGEFATANQAAAQKILDIERSKNDAIQTGIQKNFQVAGDYSHKLALLRMDDAGRAVAAIEDERAAAVAGLENYAQVHKITYDQAKAAVDAYYDHLRRKAEGSFDTLEERLKDLGVLTQKELSDEAGKAWKDYVDAASALDPITRKHKYTIDQIHALWDRWYATDQAAHKKWRADWTGTVQAVGQLFKQLSGNATGDSKAWYESVSGGVDRGMQMLGIVANLQKAMTKFKTAAPGSQQKMQAGLDAAMGGVQMMGAMLDIAQSTGSAGQKALTGAISGAMAGAASGNWQMAVGGAIAGAILGAMSAGDDAVAELQKHLKWYGQKISWELANITTTVTSWTPSVSQQLAQQIETAANDYTEKIKKLAPDVQKKLATAFQGSAGGGSPVVQLKLPVETLGQMVATSMKLAEVLAENPLSPENIGQMTEALARLDTFFKAGIISQTDYREVLNKSFGAFADYIVQTGTLASKAMLDLMKNQEAAGIHSQAVAEFIRGQVGRAVGGFSAMADAFTKPLLNAEGLRQRLKDLNEEFDKAETTSGRRIEIQVEIGDITKQLGSLTPALVHAQDQFDRLGRLAVASFAAAVASGQSFLQALTTMGPALDNLSAAAAQFGFTSNGAFKQLLQMRDWARLFPDAAAGVQGLNDMLQGLHNAGMMNQQTFTDLGDQAAYTFRMMQEQGLTGSQALQLMAPSLQTLWELQKDFGYQVDESTAALLKQAVEADVVGEKHRSAADRTAIAMEKVAGILEAMAKAMGVTVPAAADTMATKIKGVIDGLPTKIEIPVDFPTHGIDLPPVDPSRLPPGAIPEQRMATGGIVTSPLHAVVGEAGPEAVIPLDRLESWLGRAYGGDSGGDEYLPVTLEISGEAVIQTLVKVAKKHGWTNR